MRVSTTEDRAKHWVTPALRDNGVGRWIEPRLDSGNVVFRATGPMTQLEAVRQGWSIGLSSQFIADAMPELERVVPEVEQRIEIWLVTHPGLRRSARIRAAYDFLGERLEADRERLAGRS
jgi:DNA-binding transcriptional LysR family regulator